MKNKLLIFTVLIFLLGCNTDNRKLTAKDETSESQKEVKVVDVSVGYETIEEIYEAALTAIKSKNEKQIADFVSKILPDTNTAKYMGKNDCLYRGFPERLKEYPGAIDSSKILMTQKYLELAISLEKEYGSLDKLEFIRFKKPLTPEPSMTLNSKCKDILFEEAWGLLAFQNSNDTIEFKIGEMLKVNRKWKVFTVFKINY